ncbi:MAG: integrase core domain-containing protein [Verrucomicrobiota bacterium]
MPHAQGQSRDHERRCRRLACRDVRNAGAPNHIRTDNGPEFTANELRAWLRRVGVSTLYIEPAIPWENGYAESFHSRFRDECLALEVFDGLRDARTITAA